MFCGTVAARDNIVPTDRFEMEVYDPVLQRSLTHSYRVKTLPDQG